MAPPLHVAFVWHMHQPFYRDTESGQYTLPWVRLHAVKDYLHVAQVIREYPEIHQTINVVPSLAQQLQEYGDGRAMDRVMAVSQRKVLTEADKQFLLREFFSINWDHFVWPEPRYAQLARLREAASGDVDLLGDGFWTDLQVWYNLAWIDPSIRRHDPRLRALTERQGHFAPDDAEAVIAIHREMCGQVLPLYRELADRGQVELTTSPYFHPILPLLVDTRSAREASPYLALPHLRFAHPEDARDQLARGIAFHRDAFGRAPSGLWPSEGAVSRATIELVREQPDIRWVATDEHVLARALGRRFERDEYGHLRDPRPVYAPYGLDGQRPAIFFRDLTLSDRVGFVYQHWDSRAAADDLVGRLLYARERLGATSSPAIVSIILDGENCWEFYPNNGDDFLRALFERLRREPDLRTVTPGEHLDRGGPIARLDRLPAASWIGSNLETWIGEPDQNRAWEYLALARHALGAWEREHPDADASARDRAWSALRIAEGSDWFWWYYSRNRVGGEQAYDAQYRLTLANVYHAMGRPVPEWLDRPITGRAPERQRPIQGALTPPRLSGEPEPLIEWTNAGYVEPAASTGAMQSGATFFRRLYYGCDRDNLYFRLEFNPELRNGTPTIYVSTPRLLPANAVARAPSDGRADAEPQRFAWRIEVPSQSGAATLWRAEGDGSWSPHGGAGEVAVGELAIELRLALSDLGIALTDDITLLAASVREGLATEVVPTVGAVSFRPAVALGVEPSTVGLGGDEHA